MTRQVAVLSIGAAWLISTSALLAEDRLVPGTVIDCEGSGRGSHVHSGETSSAIVTGLTITNGDADGLMEMGMYWVALNDLNMFRLYYPGGLPYEPCVDFDRDGDIDEDDEVIISSWLYRLNVPADCGGNLPP